MNFTQYTMLSQMCMHHALMLMVSQYSLLNINPARYPWTRAPDRLYEYGSEVNSVTTMAFPALAFPC